MDGLKEKVFELASQDAEFAEKFGAADTAEAIIELLAEKGLDVTVEDLQVFAPAEAEGVVKLSEDELDEVAGGKKCYCFAGGGGSAGKEDATCACVVAGVGLAKDNTPRCACCGGGAGSTFDK